MIKIRISDHPAAFSECHSETQAENRADAIVYLWALAKQDVPQYGVAWLPSGVEPMTNIHMFQADPPNSLNDEIKKVVSTLNSDSIESLVQQGLNLVFYGLSRYGDDPEYIEKVTDAAREWAEECSQ